MILFIFGAGASFDSDPERASSLRNDTADDHRPPLAPGLFNPSNRVGREIVEKYPQAAALLMRLRDATRRKEDVEEALELVAVGERSYPGTQRQLVAFRAYLADLLTEIPTQWLNECQGLTNYVRLLEETDRWSAKLWPGRDAPIACVTFNYDSMLEAGVRSVFGAPLRTLPEYISDPRFRLYKPHGSVTWEQSAHWNESSFIVPRSSAIGRAIDTADTLDWTQTRYRFAQEQAQSSSDPHQVWLPALSIPIRRKATFSMPEDHLEQMKADLRDVTTVFAIGWRARERHFLQLLQDHLGSTPAQLVVVAENNTSARETVEQLWPTGRFRRYAVAGNGFTGFTEQKSEPTLRSKLDGIDDHSYITLHEILTNTAAWGAWTDRAPGYGLSPDNGEFSDISDGYTDL
jgi:hypothetical protein